MQAAVTSTFRNTLRQEMTSAAHANAIPALALQSIAFFLLWSYHYWPAARVALNQLAHLKVDLGYLFAFAGSALAGALLPMLFQSLQRGHHRRMSVAALPALLLFWGVRGCLVDGFYQMQTLLWGDNAQPLTLLLKIICDLGVFSPFFWVPSIALMFAWLDTQNRPGAFRELFAGGIQAWWRRDVWPLVVVAWIIWLPALVVIYSLPSGLQFPTQIIIQCFWALILVVLTDKR